MKPSAWTIILALTAIACGCGRAKGPGTARFKDDLTLLQEHTQVVVLSDASRRAQVAVDPDLQGRVMTSTADGLNGLSFGWINRALLAEPVNNPHMNAFGGEDRFWLGPEGGQFSIFFKPRDPFDLDHWFTPPPVNEGAFPVVAAADDFVRFKKPMRLVNYSGTILDLTVDREVRLLNGGEVAALGVPAPEGVKMVAFHSRNTITNAGDKAWMKETGLLSIWILGMFNPSPATTIVIPFRSGSESALGPAVNDAYFGKVPPDRLIVRDGILFFRGDGLYRSKIGIPPRRALPFAGSYDARNKVLTLVHLTLPAGATDYVNSMWEIQKDPFSGDAVNSYNDGPAGPGSKPLGPFYEIESSSPAAALAPGASLQHSHATVHVLGDEKALDAIARAVLHAGLEEIKAAFKK